MNRKSDKTETVIDDTSSIIAQNKRKQTNETGRREGWNRRDEERQRMENERKRQSRSHHQTNTRAGFPFLTDSNGKEEEKNKGSSGNKELIKNTKEVKLPD